MFLPILFLFLFHGIAAQAQQTDIVGQKLDSLSANQGILAGNINDNQQTLTARLDSVDSEAELIIQAAIGFNKTLNQLQDDLQTVKQRQAAAAAISVCQLLIFLAYLGTIGISYLVKCFKK